MRPIPHGPDPPVSEAVNKMEYSSDSEYIDMTVVNGDDAYKPEENDQSIPLAQAEPDTRSEPFKGVYSAVVFSSQREISVATRNNVLRISKS